MKISRTLQGVVLCVALLLVYADDSEKKSTKRKKCRCKKYIDSLNKDIEKRFQILENRFAEMLTQQSDISKLNATRVIQNDQGSDSLTEDISAHKDRLQKECQSFKQIQATIYSQEKNHDNLNKSFKSLEYMVKNLTMIVEKLEETVRSSLERRPQAWTIPEHKHNKKRKRVKPQHQETLEKDCDGVYKSGSMKYPGDYYIMIKPEKAESPFRCLCKAINGEGWTVVQRRIDGHENFSRNWEDYKNGFGMLENEFWLGNEKLHQLTSQDVYKVRIEMEDWNGKKYHAEYKRFQVGSEREEYRLQISGYDGDGNAGDSMTQYWNSHDGMLFSTRDRDNDNRFYDNCAEHYGGGWWYNDCFECNLNGRYYQNGSHNNYFVRNGIQWNSIHSYSSLKYVEIMIKPSDNAKLPNEI